jgi:hypothetical protein
MLKVIQHIYIIPLIICTALSLKTFRLRWPVHYRLFSILLILILFVESLAILWKYYFPTFPNWPYSTLNLWIYNLFLLIEYPLFLTIYYKVLRGNKAKKLILVLIPTYFLFAIINCFFIQGLFSVNSFTIIFASTSIIIATIVFFEQILKQKSFIELSRQPMVWISLGAFIFHCTNLPYIISLNYLIKTNQTIATSLYYVYLVLTCIMYSLYAIAFVCQKDHQHI